MMWNNDLEALLEEHKKGTFKEIYDELDNLIIPFNINDEKKIMRDWNSILGYENIIKKYRKIVILEALEKNDVIINRANKYILEAKKKIDVKKEFVFDKLQSELLETQKEVISVVEYPYYHNDLITLTNNKIVLDKTIIIADHCKYEIISSNAQKLKRNINSIIFSLIEKKSNNIEKKNQIKISLEKAEKMLQNQPPLDELKKTRDSLKSIIFEDSNAKEIILRYENEISIKSKINKEKNNSILKKAMKAVFFLGCAYLGFKGVDFVMNNKKPNELKKENIEHIIQEVPKTYESKIKHAISKPVVLEEKVFVQKKDPIAQHLENILINSQYTLYVEKSSNKSYLLNKKGDILLTVSHTDAIDSREKSRAGEKRTPEGLFHIWNSYINKHHTKNKLYGIGFYSLDYRNTNGSKGVMLCSAASSIIERAIHEKNDVMQVGVAYQDKDFQNLWNYIGKGKCTQVVIEDKVRRPMVW